MIESMWLVVSGILVSALFFLIQFARGIYEQKNKNQIDEIDLSAKKISFDTHTKPIADLVSESNKSHGANDVVDDAGNDPKKK